MRLVAMVTLLLGLTIVTAAQQRRPAPAPARPAATPAAREAAVPFAVGETLTYDVSWSQLLVAGTATTRVVEKRPSFGSIAYAVSAEGRPIPLVARLYPLFYKMDSLVDSYSLLSQWSSLYTEERSRKRLASTRFDRNTHRAHYEISNDPASKLDFPVPRDVQDGLTMLYTLRTRAFRAGDRFSAPIADDGSMYSVDFATSGPERIDVPIGPMRAWKVNVSIVDEMKAPVGRNIALWFSADERRLPGRIEAELPVGTFVLALREAH